MFSKPIFLPRQTMTAFCLAATLIVSCNKKENNPTPKTNADLIVGSWKQTAMTSDVDIAGTKDMWSYWPACRKDNTETYGSNGELTIDEGATKCDPNAPQSVKGPYSVSNNILTVGGFTYTLLQLDDATLKYSYPTVSVTGSDTVHLIATLTFQRH